MLCVIPARGGSRGIPRKNLIELCGKPLIAWSIEQAMLTPAVTDVVVATDDDEIAEVAEMFGAIVYRRSEHSSTDDAASEIVLREVIEEYQPESVVFLQATSPIRQPDDIQNAILKFTTSNADSLFSARNIVGYSWDASGRVLTPSSQRLPRQRERRKVIEENGSIYVFKSFCVKEHNNRLAGKIVYYLMHPLDSFQIDEPSDIPLIESLMEIRLGSHASKTE